MTTDRLVMESPPAPSVFEGSNIRESGESGECYLRTPPSSLAVGLSDALVTLPSMKRGGINGDRPHAKCRMRPTESMFVCMQGEVRKAQSRNLRKEDRTKPLAADQSDMDSVRRLSHFVSVNGVRVMALRIEHTVQIEQGSSWVISDCLPQQPIPNVHPRWDVLWVR